MNSLQRRSVVLLAVLAFPSGIFPQASSQGAEPRRISSAEMIETARALDGREVLFEGEAIGEALRRGDHAWINATDAGGAIGIWAPLSLLPLKLGFGSWKGSGDRLLVRGTFRRACPEHGGDLDIHADLIEVLGRGAPRPHPLIPARWLSALALLALAAALFPVWRSSERSVRNRLGSSRRGKMAPAGKMAIKEKDP